jgi:hypothetical protein
MTATPENSNGGIGRKLGHGAVLALSFIATVFLAGATVGFFDAQDGAEPLGTMAIAVGALLAGLTVACAAVALRSGVALLRGEDRTIAPSVRKGRQLTLLSGVLGAAIGTLMLIGEAQSGSTGAPDIFSNAPLPAWVAITLVGVLLTVMPWITWSWHRSVDEHDLGAYRDGAVLGIYAYSLLSICWWLGWRGGLLPAVDGIAIFIATYIVWGGVWLWRRYL